LGRGSPTGVVCYRHVQFPEYYRGGIFALDWTFGKVHFLKLKRAGSSYACDKEGFLESVGDNGFAPTAGVVHPQTGDLYVAIGGRGTRGAVYRVRYPKGIGPGNRDAAGKLQPSPRSLDWKSDSDPLVFRQALSDDLHVRLASLNLIRRHQKHY